MVVTSTSTSGAASSSSELDFPAGDGAAVRVELTLCD